MKHKRILAQVLPKRNMCDLFQNSSCSAASETKLACNFNTSAVMNESVNQCKHECQNKQNQNEETAKYKEVKNFIKKLNGHERTHEADESKASSLICKGAFAHNKNNVVSSCFALYFLKNESRFCHSENFAYCLLRDLQRIHNKQKIREILKCTANKSCYFENLALNYLCRHESLKTLSSADMLFFLLNHLYGWKQETDNEKNCEHTILK